MRKIFPLSFIAASFFVAAQVLAHQGATGIVKERMDAFKASQTHLKSAVKAAKADNFDETQKLARLLADWGTKMPDFFPAGSDIMPSEAAPTIWSDMEGFKRAATQFADAANQLAAASAARNKEAVFASIKQVGASCKSCHRVYRQK
jgi:cytochrome c556